MTKSEKDFRAECERAWLQAVDRHWLGEPAQSVSLAESVALDTIIAAAGDRTPELLRWAVQHWRTAVRGRVARAMGQDTSDTPADARLTLLADHVDLVLAIMEEPAAPPAPAVDSDLVRIAARAWNQYLQRIIDLGSLSQRAAERIALTPADVTDISKIVERIGDPSHLFSDLHRTLVPARQLAAARAGRPYEHSYGVSRPADVLRDLDAILAYLDVRQQLEAQAAAAQAAARARLPAEQRVAEFLTADRRRP